MAQKITSSYATKGTGTLDIDDDKNIFILLEDVDEPVNLADLLTKYNGCEVAFNFTYNKTYEA